MCKLKFLLSFCFVATRQLVVCVDGAKLQWRQAQVL